VALFQPGSGLVLAGHPASEPVARGIFAESVFQPEPDGKPLHPLPAIRALPARWTARLQADCAHRTRSQD